MLSLFGCNQSVTNNTNETLNNEAMYRYEFTEHNNIWHGHISANDNHFQPDY